MGIHVTILPKAMGSIQVIPKSSARTETLALFWRLYARNYLSVVLWGWHGSVGRHGLRILLIFRTILGPKGNYGPPCLPNPQPGNYIEGTHVSSPSSLQVRLTQHSALACLRYGHALWLIILSSINIIQSDFIHQSQGAQPHL